VAAVLIGFVVLSASDVTHAYPKVHSKVTSKRPPKDQAAPAERAKPRQQRPEWAWNACAYPPHQRDRFPRVPYREGDEIPPCYTVETASRRGTWISGVILAGAGLAVMGGLAVAYDFRRGSGWYLLPIVGPAFQSREQRDALAAESCNDTGSGCAPSSKLVLPVMLVVGEGLEISGALLTVVGLLAKRDYLVPVTSDVGVLPMPMGGGYGLVGVGRF
jgi:hypothetical protein